MPCPDPDDVSQAANASQLNGSSGTDKDATSVQAKRAAKAEKQRQVARNLKVCSRCHSPNYTASLESGADSKDSEAQDDRAVLKLREETFCAPCALRLISHRASRGPGGYSHARGACLLRREVLKRKVGEKIQCAPDRKEASTILLALSGGPSSRALLHLSAGLFGVNMHPPKRASKGKSKEVNGHRIEEGNSENPAKAKQRTAGGTKRPTDVEQVDVLHIDDTALFYPGEDDRIQQERKKRRASLENMVQETNTLVSKHNDLEEGSTPYRLQVLYLEDIFASDEQLLGLLDRSREDVAKNGDAVRCPVSQMPDTTLAIGSTIGDKERTSLLQQLFADVVAANASSSSSSATPRTALTRAEDLHRILLDVLLRRVALLRNPGSTTPKYQSLLLGTCGTRIATRLMDALSKGEGAKLPISNSVAHWIGTNTPDQPADAKVLILRPLSEVGIKELGWFNRTLKLETILPRDLADSELLFPGLQRTLKAVGVKSSLEALTESFVFTLEKGVSSTASTIEKTRSKLVLKGASASTKAESIGASVPIPSRKSFLDKSQYTDIRIGAQQKLVADVCDIPEFPSKDSRGTPICPFCTMPSQSEDARMWRSRISIRSTVDRKDAPVPPPTQGQDLSSKLCYACTLVLDPPSAPSDGALHLPVYILRYLSQPKTFPVVEDSGVEGMQDEVSDQTSGTQQQMGERLPLEKVTRESMRQRFENFLLTDDVA